MGRTIRGASGTRPKELKISLYFFFKFSFNTLMVIIRKSIVSPFCTPWCTVMYKLKIIQQGVQNCECFA